MMKEFDSMQKKMMKGFFGDDGPMSLFKDDPFFKDSGFGRMGDMFSNVESMMNQASQFSGKGGHFSKQTYSMS
jgi:hypothetical protein